ncbi:MAG TPA: HD-GYP domain-containing protein [Bryobacteraceae bacterium]|jgi:putative nucleotidyltransferase with HDIG domain
MRLGVRTFLWSFLPFALLLTGSFWAVQRMVVRAVRDQFRASARETQVSIARLRSSAERRNGRLLGIVAENPALKNGLQLMLEHRGDHDPAKTAARRTLEDQLMEMGGELGFEVLLVSDPVGEPLAAVMFRDDRWTPFDPGAVRPPRQGYFNTADRTYQASSVAVDQADENLGILTVGEPFELSSLPIPAVFMRDGKVVESNLDGALPAVTPELESSLRNCPMHTECEVRLAGAAYLSMPMGAAPTGEAGNGFQLRSLQNLDSAARPIQSMLRNMFSLAGLCALVGALLLSSVSSRSIVRPISELIARLRESERTGELPEFDGGVEGRSGGVHEIRALTDSFNRAAASVREGRERLREALVEFIQSLASALDARDPYTAGHSRRVSQYACAVARNMGVSPKELDEIRVGALLHDIGKIGVADAILQKPGRLTDEENRIIQEHPTIGRKILEGVQGFHPYLPVVELHHENWDGTGYPHGLRRDATPLTARIVKIADAYDAMTSDRPYRRGMPHEKALVAIANCSGTQMDPAVVDAFLSMSQNKAELGLALTSSDSLQRLADAVGAHIEVSPLVGKGS